MTSDSKATPSNTPDADTKPIEVADAIEVLAAERDTARREFERAQRELLEARSHIRMLETDLTTAQNMLNAQAVARSRNPGRCKHEPATVVRLLTANMGDADAALCGRCQCLYVPAKGEQ